MPLKLGKIRTHRYRAIGVGMGRHSYKMKHDKDIETGAYCVHLEKR